jgi:phosphoribosylglycinamide formyltransferase-1
MRTLAILASGQGTNFEALALASRRGQLGGLIAVLVTDQPDAPALDRARRLGIEALTLPVGRFRSRIEDETPWIAALQSRSVDTVLLAGFMRRLHAPFLAAYPDGVLNVHPSLLPAFPGLDAIRQALEHGARVTGVTVHMVDDALDAGPILAQAPVPIEDDDTLATLEARVHEVEHELYPQTVRRFLTEPWRREGRRITFHVPTAGGTRG